MKETKSAKDVMDVIKKRNELLYKLKKLDDDLNSTSKNPFKDKKDKKIIKNEIIRIKDELSGLSILVKESSRFKSNEFCLFLENLLKLSYEDLEISRIKVNDPYSCEKCNNSKIIYFISNNLTKRVFIEDISNDRDLEEFRENNDSTIIIDTDYIEPFDNNIIMKEEYRKHLVIKNAIYELIDLYIKEPRLSDEERLNKVLENRIMKNINKSNNK